SAPRTYSFPPGSMKSTWVSTSQSARTLGNEFETGIRAEAAAHLRRFAAVREHDVAREVVRAADQRRTDAVGVDRHAGLLERLDPLHREAARDDDPHPLEAVAVERVTDIAHQALVDAARVEVA